MSEEEREERRESQRRPLTSRAELKAPNSRNRTTHIPDPDLVLKLEEDIDILRVSIVPHGVLSHRIVQSREGKGKGGGRRVSQPSPSGTRERE